MGAGGGRTPRSPRGPGPAALSAEAARAPPGAVAERRSPHCSAGAAGGRRAATPGTDPWYRPPHRPPHRPSAAPAPEGSGTDPARAVPAVRPCGVRPRRGACPVVARGRSREGADRALPWSTAGAAFPLPGNHDAVDVGVEGHGGLWHGQTRVGQTAAWGGGQGPGRSALTATKIPGYLCHRVHPSFISVYPDEGRWFPSGQVHSGLSPGLPALPAQPEGSEGGRGSLRWGDGHGEFPHEGQLRGRLGCGGAGRTGAVHDRWL